MMRTNAEKKKLLVIQVAGLGYDFLSSCRGTQWGALTFLPLETVFPAVTCTVQASFRTGLSPAGHGMIGNGVYSRDFCRPFFWEQSSALVQGERFWHDGRRRGQRVGMLFWQQSLGEEVDLLVSPGPIHKHHGGMIEACFSRPEGLYRTLCQKVGRPFRLRDYWGPLASARASAWIAAATEALLSDASLAPDLCLTYLPALDYDLQRYGPDSTRGKAALNTLFDQLDRLVPAATAAGYEAVIFGDYAIGSCLLGAVLPNRVLRKAGLLATRAVAGMLYPDFCSSRAFAVVDHEIAHVYVRDPGDRDVVRHALQSCGGVAEVCEAGHMEQGRHAHPNSGELVLVAEEGHWLAYPWWDHEDQAPDYARHVDIHNKPGFDPCELFLGWPPMTITRDLRRVRGSHGRIGPSRRTAWTATCGLGSQPETLIGLVSALKAWMHEGPQTGDGNPNRVE